VSNTELGDWLRKQLKRRRLSQNAFVSCTGLSKGTVSDIINKGHVPKPEVLNAIADYFNEPRQKVYQLAGLLASKSELDPHEEEALYLFRQLGPVERKRILQSMRAWLEQE
jgi:transcriptional regulator with XRE-family HTH domain